MINFILLSIVLSVVCIVMSQVAVQKVSSGRRLFDFYGREYPAIFVIGRRRQGKSVHKSTRLLVRINGETKVMTIEELERLPIKQLYVEIPAVDSYLMSIVWTKVNHIWKHEPEEELYKIKTRTGKEVIATGDHSFLTFDKFGNLVKTKTSNLTFSSILPSARQIPIEEDIFLDVERYIGKSKHILVGNLVNNLLNKLESNKIPIYSTTEVYNYIKTSGVNVSAYGISNWRTGHREKPKNDLIYGKENRNNPLKEKLPYTWELGYIFGLYLSEGSLTHTGVHKKTKSCIRFSNQNKNIINKLSECLDKIGMTNHYIEEKGIRLNSIPFSILLNRLFGSGAGEKLISTELIQTPREFRHGLIAGYFDGDGEVSMSRETFSIGATSKSKQLIDSIQLILRTLGILSNSTKPKLINGVKYYKLGIPTVDGIKLLSTGMVNSRKVRILSNLNNIKNRFSTNYYNILRPRETVKQYKSKKTNKTWKSKRLPFEIIKDHSLKGMVVGERIKEKTIHHGTGFVYDIETKHHNFMLSNGMFVHNSVMVEWAAEKYWEHGYLVLDMMDAGDFESCYWAIPDCPKKDCDTPLGYRKHCTICDAILYNNYCKKCKLTFESNDWNWKPLVECPICGTPVSEAKTNYKILMVYPSNATVKSVNPAIEPVSCELGLEKIVRKALAEKAIVSVATGLFDSDELYLTLANWMMEWVDLKRDKIRTNAVLVIREASNVAFSTMKTSPYQTELKRAIINLIRFAGHYQSVILFDTQRFKDLHIAARDVIETVIIKRHNFHGMPDVVNEVYKDLTYRRYLKKEQGATEWDLKKHLTLPTELFKSQFIVRFDDGYYVRSQNGMPKFHHKGPRDFFLDYAGLNVTKQPHRFLARDAQTVRQIPKSILKSLAYQMIERDGIDEELVAEWLEFTPQTIRGWVRAEIAEINQEA